MRVGRKLFQKDRTMKHHIRSISLGALLALAVASVSAQTAAPAAGASAPATVGVTPQEAATANRQAVPRSDTGTVVRTAPSPAQRASGVMSDTTTGAPASNTGGTATMNSTTGNAATGTTRAARADRN